MLSRRIAIVGAVAAFPLLALAHPHDKPKSTEQVEQELKAFRVTMKAAMEAKDAVKLKGMYTDTYSHTHGSGKVDGRDARIVSLLTGDPVIEDAPVTEMVVRVHGDTAILSGRSPILNKAENKHYDFRWIQVYVREDGAWKLAASQATRLPTTA